ncbi:hypothetical protein [Verrucomicrobium sp. BvORR034]|uniref:hypothetical protein n=1 Tax=Verrucomicrobium sp. BvORR034 TaxID=1396418 RepID=UPI00067904E1|nr:hypothetical protein [Verrucomicrobium sp. BvORR034]
MRTLPALSICLCLGLAASQLSAQAPAGPKSDVVVLQNGAAVPCRIVSSTAEMLRIEYRPAGAMGLMTREVPWTEIRSADFLMDEEFHALLRTTDAARDGARLASRWEAVLPLLSRPNHPGGDLGLAYANACVASPAPATRSKALDICDVIISNDWNPQRRAQARWTRIQALVALNRTQDALGESRKILADHGTDEWLAVRALLFTGKHSFEALKQLQSDNPRWEEDDLIVPERNRLFHESVECSVKPSLFHGTQEESATAGLWQAAAVLQFDGNLSAAADCARDILHLYPKAKEAGEVREFLMKHKLPLEVPVTLPELPEEPAKPMEKPAADAPKEPESARRKRYAKPESNNKPPEP